MLDDKKIFSSNGGISVDNSGENNNLSLSVTNIGKLSSLLNPLLEKIIEEYDRVETYQVQDPNENILGIEAKITFNSVKVYAEDLRESAGYMSLIEELIDCIDDQKPRSKESFLKAIKRNYKNHKKNLLIEHGVDPQDTAAVQEIICQNADKLIQAVAKTILDHASNSWGYPVEMVQTAQELIVGYGFINCQILEKPNDPL